MANKIQTLWLFRQIMQPQIRKTADLTPQKKDSDKLNQ